MRARADDAALEIVLEHVDSGGVRAAGQILAVIEGSLGRVESVRPEAPWLVRVPIHAARAQYLMLIEGDLPVAIPWHSVLHIVMARTAELEHDLAAPRIRPIRLLLTYSLGLDLGRVPLHNSTFSSAKSRSNHRACPLASIPTRLFLPCAARSR